MKINTQNLLISAIFTILSIGSWAAIPVYSEALPENEVSAKSELTLDNGLVDVNLFTGNASKKYLDVSIPGTGGLTLQIHRSYDHSRVRSGIWDCLFIYGTLCPDTPPLSSISFGSKPSGWAITAAPLLYISEGGTISSFNGNDPVCRGVSVGTIKPSDPNTRTGVPLVYYRLIVPSGDEEALVMLGGGIAETRSGWRLTCSGGVHYVHSPEGRKYTFGLRRVIYDVDTVDGVPAVSYQVSLGTKVEDSFGNWISFNYTDFPFPATRPYLTSIVGSDGRTVSLNYEDFRSGNFVRKRIRSITTGSNTLRTYYYNLNHQLSEVVAGPDFKWKYEYWPEVGYDFSKGGVATPQGAHAQPTWAKSSALKKVTLPTGGSIELDYAASPVYKRNYFGWDAWPISDSCDAFWQYACEQFDPPRLWNLQVTSQKTSAGGIFSYSYAPGTTAGAYDLTTLTTPSGVETYKFFGSAWFLGSSNKFWSGGDSSRARWIYGDSWRYGLPAEITKGLAYSEAYIWEGALFTNAFRQHVLSQYAIYDVNSYVPALKSKIVTINGATFRKDFSGFDRWGNPSTIVETGPNGGNRTTSVTYFNDLTKWIIGKRKDEVFNGGSTLRAFDANGKLLSISVDGVTKSYTYTPQGDLATATLPRGQVYTYSNHKRGIAQTVVEPEGVNLSRVVDAAGNIISETDGEGRTTGYTYDVMNRLTSVAHPTGNGVSIIYTPTAKTETRGTLVETTQYDPFGRRASVNRGGVTTLYTYDALGRMTFESNPGDTVGKTYQYDILDRITRLTQADNRFLVYTYGPATKTITDERNNSTTYTYRAYGDPSKQFLMNIAAPVAAASVSITRNARDLIATVTQDGSTRTYGYNANYHLTSVINPESGTTTYGRDAAGNMTSSQVGTSPVTTFGYDGRNRLTSISYPSGTPSVTKTYTKTDRLKTESSSVSTRTYSYDQNDNVISDALVVDGIILTTSYAYNGNDQLSSITYPRSNRVVSYAPDALGRPTQVSGYVTAVTYWPSGQFKQINYANGTVSSYGQNNRLWPSTFSTTRSGATYLNSSYGYDGVGNLTGISDTVDASFNRVMGYDSIDRVTSAQGPWGSGTIGYSGGSNITSQAHGTFSLSYTYDAQNRLSGVSGSRVATYGYDRYGNITSGGGNVYSYDDASRLRCINCADPVNKIEYTYDAAGRRVSTTKAGFKAYEVHDTKDHQLIEYVPSQANKLTEFIYLGGKRVAQSVSP